MAEQQGSILEASTAAIPPDLANKVAIIAYCPSLDATIPQIVTAMSFGNVRAQAGYGYGCDLAAHGLRMAADLGNPATAFIVSHPATVPSSAALRTQTGFGPVVLVSKTDPDKEYHENADVRVRCTKTGAPGVAQIQIATEYIVRRDLDGGAPDIVPNWQTARVMPQRSKATIIGNVDLTTLVYAKPAYTFGSVDIITTAALYGASGTLAGKEFDLNMDGGGLVTVTFGSGASAPITYLDVLNTINLTALADIASVDNLGRLNLTGIAVSGAGSIVLVAGSPNALTVLGLTAGTYNGSAGILDNKTIVYEGDATSGEQTYTFPQNGLAVLDATEARIALNALTGIDADLYTTHNYLRLMSATQGSSSALEIASGTALTVLGIEPASATGAESTIDIPHLGATLTFPAGTYTAGYETWHSVKAPLPSVDDIIDSIDALIDQQVQFGRVVIASEIPLVQLVATIQALDAKGTELESRLDAKFTHNFSIFAPIDESDDDVYAAITSSPSRRVHVAARSGYFRPAIRPVNSGAVVRSQGWHLTAMYMALPLGSDAGQRRSGRALNIDWINQDEQTATRRLAPPWQTSSLPSANVLEIQNQTFYFSGGYTLALPESWYHDAYVYDVVSRAAQVTHAALSIWLNDPSLPTKNGGRLSPEGAASVVASISSMLTPALRVGQERPLVNKAPRISVDTSEVILGPEGTKRIKASVTIEPLGIGRSITFTVGAGLILTE